MQTRAWTVVVAVLATAGIAARTAERNPLTPAQQQALSPAAALQAILAAEDSRIDLPDDIRTPATDAIRARKIEDVRLLLSLTRSPDAETQKSAIRALGRFERRELVTDLLPFLTSPALRAETANALAQALRGDPLPGVAAADQVQGVLEALMQIGETDNTPALGAISRSIARLPFVRPGQVRSADAFLLAAMRRVDPDPDRRAVLDDITRGVESLVRLHGKLAPIDADTVDWLRRIATGIRRSYPAAARVNAMAALVGARGVDEDTLRRAAEATGVPDLRRLAAISLGGAGSPVVPSERTDLLTTLLKDPSEHVRLEALRAWARQETAANGCGRLLDAMKDDKLSIVLAATDLLGDQCPDDQNVTDRLTVEARTPPPNEWHAASHALVALAKRAPARVFIPLLGSHISHATWQVRMYAARGAALTNDTGALERLALDPNDNVREATLAALKRLKKDEAEPYFLAALARSDYQLLRTAAVELNGLTPTPALAAALVEALKRVTLDRSETSRDTRIALLERLKEFGDPDQAGALVPLLRDFDVRVALLAGAILQQWTGRAQEIAPQLLPRPPVPTAGELAEAADQDKQVRIELKNGRLLTIQLMPDVAPLSSVRILRLVKEGYYNGTTFHRVVPNFVIQGGSPGANEYAGAPSYLRDEISLQPHTAGAVGLSTRGRDTGDAQFYVNLVDNPRLDFEYTVFGAISGDVDAVAEGEPIDKVTFEKLTPEDRKKIKDPRLRAPYP
jgi:cyclophilin family peptidyl-prolyl cis-trans isomerase/HEAT repeat protein